MPADARTRDVVGFVIRAGDIDANGLLMLTEERVAPPSFFANRIQRTRPAFEREERGAPSQ